MCDSTIPLICPRAMKTYVHKGLTHDVYYLIYNSEKLEATHVSVNSWDDTQIMVYPHNGIHRVESTVKKKKLPIHTGMDESQKQYTEQKKPKWVPSIWLYITMGIIDVCGLGILTRYWLAAKGDLIWLKYSIFGFIWWLQGCIIY